MHKLITVIGGTGVQGGSVARALLNNDNYVVRVVTRNTKSEAANSLRAQGAEIVQADLNDASSLQTAFVGSYAIFAATNFFDSFLTVGADESVERESTQGINLAKAAAATPTLQHYIWSTLPNAGRISNGKAFVPHYAGKNRVDDYIKSDPVLLSKTTFLWVSFYVSNMDYPWYKPIPVVGAGPDRYIQLFPGSPSVPLTLVGDARTNIGLFVREILEQPQKTLPGKFVLAATDEMTMAELVSLWASVHGKKADCVQVDRKMYYDMWPMWGQVMDASHIYWDQAKEKTWSGEDTILTRHDLGVIGLIDTATALANMGI
ncbi:hypothetical protein F4677DRAFT_464711 [Hypoxylon crocopeplum]|nr:hypothetical protein F4677DRAFT_464711 [Hypoxylon crocopeplum]